MLRSLGYRQSVDRLDDLQVGVVGGHVPRRERLDAKVLLPHEHQIGGEVAHDGLLGDEIIDLGRDPGREDRVDLCLLRSRKEDGQAVN